MDAELVTHALTVARSRGFAELELSDGEGSFFARLDPAPPAAKKQKAQQQAAVESDLGEIKATVVGYYREAREPLKVGRAVQVNDVVAVIAALGIANDVESKVAGEVIEVLVEPNQPVEYGQPLARVRLR